MKYRSIKFEDLTASKLKSKVLPIGTILEYPCPECGGKMELRQSRYGLFYGCKNYPNCDATHGAHQETGEPLGTPADHETRNARIAAHFVFDYLWKRGGLSRGYAYQWLARKFEKDEIHIGSMTTKECEKVIELVMKWRNENER